MTYRSRILLKAAAGLAGVAGLALFAYFGVYRVKKNEDRQEQIRKQVFEFDLNKVTRIAVTTGDVSVAAERLSSTEQGLPTWQLTEPVSTAGDTTSINALLNTLERLETIQTIAGPDGLDRKRYGLETPQGILTALFSDGKSVGLRIGKRSSYNSNLYVQKEGSTEVLLISGDEEAALLKKLFDLRRKELTSFDPARVRKLVITRDAEKIELERTDTGWRLVKPVTDTADANEVEQFLNAARALRATDFLDQISHAEKAYGLDPPTVKVEMLLDGDGSLRVLLLGHGTLESNNTKVYAQSLEPASSIAEVPDYQVKNLQKTVFDLRERLLVRFDREAVYQIKLASDAALLVLEKKVAERLDEKGGPPVKEETWSLISPKTGPATTSKVNELVSKLSQLKIEQFVAQQDTADLSRYGLHRPLWTVSLLGKEGQDLGSLRVGKAIDRPAERSYVIGSNRPYVCQVETKQLEPILMNVKDLEENPPKPASQESTPAQ